MVRTSHDEPDYYAVLGLPEDATAREIERAYRELAGKRLNAHWRPGRAARELALINAAYGVLGYADRREDYDRRRSEAASRPHDAVDDDAFGHEEPPHMYQRPSARHLPGVQLGRRTMGSSPIDAVVILLVVVLALFIASLLASQSLFDLGVVQDFGERLGIQRSRRPAPARGATVLAGDAEAKPSPSPAGATPVPQTAPLGALPTAVVGQLFAGSEVQLSDNTPARQSTVTLTLRLVREGRPVSNANVYLVSHYRTTDERQPPGTATVKTDENGTARISFNIGDATSNYPVKMDVTALVDGQQVVFQTSFTPR
jgi:hypothetical protein